MAGSNETLMRLYEAASCLVFADGLAEHIDRLEHEKKSWALTDAEVEQYTEASEHLRVCLATAADQLRLNAASSDARADAARLLWKRTRQIPDEAATAGR